MITRLPTSVRIANIECNIDADYRNILQIFIILSDPDLLKIERITTALSYFYTDDTYFQDIEYATKYMFEFINMGELETYNNSPQLYDWEQDFNLIVAPINRVLGQDVRGLDFLHWWTFLSAFYEIGECTFSTFVAIRNKKLKHIKLEKYEERIYKENSARIQIKKKVDNSTQELFDTILGRR